MKYIILIVLWYYIVRYRFFLLRIDTLIQSFVRIIMLLNDMSLLYPVKDIDRICMKCKHDQHNGDVCVVCR